MHMCWDTCALKLIRKTLQIKYTLYHKFHTRPCCCLQLPHMVLVVEMNQHCPSLGAVMLLLQTNLKPRKQQTISESRRLLNSGIRSVEVFVLPIVHHYKILRRVSEPEKCPIQIHDPVSIKALELLHSPAVWHNRFLCCG